MFFLNRRSQRSRRRGRQAPAKANAPIYPWAFLNPWEMAGEGSALPKVLWPLRALDAFKPLGWAGRWENRRDTMSAEARSARLQANSCSSGIWCCRLKSLLYWYGSTASDPCDLSDPWPNIKRAGEGKHQPAVSMGIFTPTFSPGCTERSRANADRTPG